jgi:hypothetical protein
VIALIRAANPCLLDYVYLLSLYIMLQIDLELIKKAQSEIKKFNELQDITSIKATDPIPFQVGKRYFIRTVTYHCIIEVKKIIGSFLEGQYVWIADSGRFKQAIEDAELDEVEPIDIEPAGVNINAIVDYFLWQHDVPTKQK